MSMQWGYVTNSSFRSNRNARIITEQFVKLLSPYASYFRLEAQMVRLTSGANELFYDRFPYKWENGAIFVKRSTDYWTPIFVEKGIKNEFQNFDIAFCRQAW